jgi:hypothetical protein
MALTPEQIQAYFEANSGGDDKNALLAALLAGKGGSFSNKSDLAALTGNEMGINYGMGAAALGGAAIPFIQAMRLRKEARNYKPTDLVPQQSRDIVQTLGQQLNAPSIGYVRDMQNANAARAARNAGLKRGAASSSDFLRGMYASEDMYNKVVQQTGSKTDAERMARIPAFNAALASLGAQEAASAQKNREARAAILQGRDISFAKSGEALINGLINSVVLKNPKEKPNKTGANNTSTGNTGGDLVKRGQNGFTTQYSSGGNVLGYKDYMPQSPFFEY